MLTLTLLHPNKALPIQNWTFESETTIRIGRAVDNDVVLFSAVVSRHHLELHQKGLEWEIINLGANGTFVVILSENGTFVDSKAIQKIPVVDGMIVRLASSGPKLQIHIQSENSHLLSQYEQSHQSLSVPSLESTSVSATLSSPKFSK